MAEQSDTATHLEAIRRALTVVADDRPTPEQIAEWNTADKEMAQKVRAALPGVPLHHAYAVLQAVRTFQRLDAAAAPSTDQAALVADAIGPTMLLGLQDAELFDEPGQERIRDWIKWISETVAALPLPAPADRAAVLEEAADVAARWNSDCQNCAVELEVATELRRLAAEAPATTQADELGGELEQAQAERKEWEDTAYRHAGHWRKAQAAIERVRALHRKASHGATCVYCAHGQRLGYDTDWPCDTIRALEGTEQPAVAPPAEAADTETVDENEKGTQIMSTPGGDQQPATETVHACPPDGSGLTPCCGRTPFELPLGDRISSEAPTTCKGGDRG